MDVEDFYRLAQQLHGNGKQEVVYREVISLSYYACFHQINPLAQYINLPTPPERKGMHSNLCWGLQAYGKHNYDNLPKDIARKFYSLGLKIEAARKRRTEASYYVDMEVTNDMTNYHLKNAQAILSLIQDIKDSLKAVGQFEGFFSHY